jgi:hypothetical protein
VSGYTFPLVRRPTSWLVVTGNLGTWTHFTGNRVNQALEILRAFPRSRIESVCESHPPGSVSAPS